MLLPGLQATRFVLRTRAIGFSSRALLVRGYARSASDEDERGRGPPLPSAATPQDAPVTPMYPNMATVRGEQPPLPTDEDRPVVLGGAPAPLLPPAPAQAPAPAATLNDKDWGTGAAYPSSVTVGPDITYPKAPPAPPRGQEPPLPTDAVQPAFTAPPMHPQPPPPPLPPPVAEPLPRPAPPPKKKRGFTKLLLTFVLGSVLGAAYVPWIKSVNQDTRALEAILVEREKAGEKYIQGVNEYGQYVLKPSSAASKRLV